MERAEDIAERCFDVGRHPDDSAGMDSDDLEWMYENDDYRDYIIDHYDDLIKDAAEEAEEVGQRKTSKTSTQPLAAFQWQPAYKLPRMGYQLDRGCERGGGSFNHQSRFNKMNKIWLKGNRIENDHVDYAVGVVRQGKLHITPVDIVAQMR